MMFPSNGLCGGRKIYPDPTTEFGFCGLIGGVDRGEGWERVSLFAHTKAYGGARVCPRRIIHALPGKEKKNPRKEKGGGPRVVRSEGSSRRGRRTSIRMVMSSMRACWVAIFVVGFVSVDGGEAGVSADVENSLRHSDTSLLLLLFLFCFALHKMETKKSGIFFGKFNQHYNLRT